MSNLALRIISAAVLLPAVIALILFAPPLGFAGAMVFFASLAGFEYGNITVGKTFRGHRFTVAFLAAMVCAGVALYSQFAFAPMAALCAVFPVAAILFMFTASDLSKSVPAFTYTVTGAVYTGSLFGVIALILSTSDSGRYWVILLLGGAVLSDTFAYTFGRLLGKRKLAPKISPGKTWAGAIGGVFGSMAAVAAAKATLLPELEWIDVALLGAPLSIFCQVGDLAESFLKRGFGVKDSGKIIPGHGGILDRCDALMFGAPVVLLFTLIR